MSTHMSSSGKVRLQGHEPLLLLLAALGRVLIVAKSQKISKGHHIRWAYQASPP
ncbi:hypothetical protein BYT27DRAFT_7196805 [Phlegmacium glaucopus]|nr:hypothetical protein BYT27DRAFT_7196805 [Phlegmacium glaucopus]